MNVMLGHSAAPVAVIVFDVSKLAESLRSSILYRQQRHVRICFRFVGKLYADAFQHYLWQFGEEPFVIVSSNLKFRIVFWFSCECGLHIMHWSDLKLFSLGWLCWEKPLGHWCFISKSKWTIKPHIASKCFNVDAFKTTSKPLQTTTLQNHFKTISKPLQFASFVSFKTGPRLTGPRLQLWYQQLFRWDQLRSVMAQLP